MEKLGELKECMKRLVKKTNELNESHNKDIDSFIDSFINLQNNYDTFEEFYKNEDAEDWTVEDIAKWEYLVGRQTIIRKAFNICSEELYLGEFLPNL